MLYMHCEKTRLSGYTLGCKETPLQTWRLYPVYTMKLARRAGSSSARRASSSSQLHRVNGVLGSEAT